MEEQRNRFFMPTAWHKRYIVRHTYYSTSLWDQTTIKKKFENKKLRIVPQFFVYHRRFFNEDELFRVHGQVLILVFTPAGH